MPQCTMSRMVPQSFHPWQLAPICSRRIGLSHALAAAEPPFDDFNRGQDPARVRSQWQNGLGEMDAFAVEKRGWLPILKEMGK